MQILAAANPAPGFVQPTPIHAMRTYFPAIGARTPSPSPNERAVPPATPRIQRTLPPMEISRTSNLEADELSLEEAESGAWQMHQVPHNTPNRSIFQSMLVPLAEFGNHVMARLHPNNTSLPHRTDSPNQGWWSGRPLSEAVNDWNINRENNAQSILDLDKWREIQLHEGPNCRSFSIFLDRLRETHEYKNERTRPFLKQRVQELLVLLQQDDQAELRSLYFSLSPDAISLCGDRIALKFDDMELAALNHQAERGNYSTNELINIGLQMFQLDCLKKIASEKSLAIARAQGRTEYTEALEVELAYRVALGAEQELNLPVRSASMLYPGISNVTPEDISIAKEKILKASRNKDQTTQFLIHWLPWSKQLERDHPREFSHTREHIHAEQNKIFQDLEQLEDRIDNNEISHARYQIEAEALQQRFSNIDADEMDKLKIRLTQAFH